MCQWCKVMGNGIRANEGMSECEGGYVHDGGSAGG